MAYDAIIIQSHLLTPDRMLSRESIARIDEGLRLYGNGAAPRIIMSGGPSRFTKKTMGGEHGGFYVPRNSSPVHSQVMADYACSKGFPKQRMAIQVESEDSVGEKIFERATILDPHALISVVSVTSDYHAPRIRMLSERIYGTSMTFDVAQVPLDAFREENKTGRAVLEQKEKESWETFLRDFGDIEKGKVECMLKRLYEKHELYADIPSSERFVIGKSPRREFGDLEKKLAA